MKPAQRIDRAETGDPGLLSLLERHPEVASVVFVEGLQGLTFWQGDWRRQVLKGDPTTPLSGLVEFVDNNPLVCADAFSVPDPVSTLALIALAPLIDAGLLYEAPIVLANRSSPCLDAFLAGIGWEAGATLDETEIDLGSVVSVNAMAQIRTPEHLQEIDDLFEERFGRSFYIRRAESGEWDTQLVVEQPFALYRLRITPDEPYSLLTIQTLADATGKCGAAQMIHAMNVMAGLEESLGIG